MSIRNRTVNQILQDENAGLNQRERRNLRRVIERAYDAGHSHGADAEHRDTHQTYEGGAFVTHCTCGHATRGTDPDDADAKMFDHTNPEN